jgi:hypothetical protein
MDKSRRFEDVKFMWDGTEYGGEKEATARRAEYEKEGFLVKAVAENGKHYIFTRRVSKAADAPAA